MGKNIVSIHGGDPPAQSYSNWVDGLERTAQGKIRQTIGNSLFALRYSPKLSGILRYNEFSAKTEVVNAPWKQYAPTITDTDLNYISLELEKIGITSERTVTAAVNIAAHENSYHPIRDILNSLKWDGREHIENLFPRYLGAERNEYTEIVTKVLFGGIIGRTFAPGMKFDTCLVLQDTQQGGGKSSLCKLLAIRDEWYASLRNLDDQERVVETITGHLVIELEEMESVAAAKNIESVRSFLSRSQDSYRTPYARFSQDIRRGSVCIGTSNDPTFLPMDRAGNRRFLPLKCDKDAAEVHPLEDEGQTRAEIMQCYAQAMQLYREGNLPVKLPKEWEIKLSEIQKPFTPEDTKAGVIEQWIIGDESGSKQKYICVPMIYQHALNGQGLPKQWESKEISSILDNLEDEDGNKILKRYDRSGGIRRFNNLEYCYGRQRAWERVDPVNKPVNKTTGASEQPVNNFLSFPDDADFEIPFP